MSPQVLFVAIKAISSLMESIRYFWSDESTSSWKKVDSSTFKGVHRNIPLQFEKISRNSPVFASLDPRTFTFIYVDKESLPFL